MLGVVLLYVGAVLFVNGVWLYGLHRQQLAEAAAATGVGTAGGGVLSRIADAAILPNREIAVMNVFTGTIGFIIAVIAIIFGVNDDDVSLLALAGFVLLFAFTYLWVAANQFLGAEGRGLGWYCLFVAITAVPTGFFVLEAIEPNEAFTIWLGIDWFAWAILWFLYFLVLALQLPLLRLTAAVTVIEAIGTSWVFAWLLLTEKISGL